MSKIIYRHVGNLKFDPKQFNKIQNEEQWHKPSGGLWASPVNPVTDRSDWQEWMLVEQYYHCDRNAWFDFTLKEGADILEIKSREILKTLPITPSCQGLKSIFGIDFEKLVQVGYQGFTLEITHDRRLYWDMYGYDVDTLVVFDPSIMEVL